VNQRDKLRALENAERNLRGSQVYVFYKHLVGALMEHVDGEDGRDGRVIGKVIQDALNHAREVTHVFNADASSDPGGNRAERYPDRCH
jgi:hypothetical protein